MVSPTPTPSLSRNGWKGEPGLALGDPGVEPRVEPRQYWMSCQRHSSSMSHPNFPPPSPPMSTLKVNSLLEVV